MPSDVVIFVLIIALLWANSRREIWKHRAQMRQKEIESLTGRLNREREANIDLAKMAPGVKMLYYPTEWPEDLEDA